MNRCPFAVAEEEVEVEVGMELEMVTGFFKLLWIRPKEFARPLVCFALNSALEQLRIAFT